MSRSQPFLNIRTEGALLPSDLLARLLEGANLPGLRPEDYHLGAGEKLNEAISRSWTRLIGLWGGFRKSQVTLPATDLGTTLTREKWLLQLFQELGYGRLLGASPFEIDGKSYPVSHLWHGQHYQVPVHLVSFRAELDKRSEQKIQGASKASPHGLMQEFLNRSEPHLWAFVSNGLKLRLLRDNASLTRQAHVEFDLEGIFDGEAYSDFRLLWLVCHQSRGEGTTKDRPETCWLEIWSKQAQSDGRRALDQLRIGVEKALTVLGTGFISHPANKALRDRLQAGELRKEDFYRQLLRLAYRLIFLFVAEDRDLIHTPDASERARSCYAKFYSGQRLRRMAERSRGSRHSDLWVGLRLVFQILGRDEGCPELGLPSLGGFLFGAETLPDIDGSELANEHLQLAIRHLCLVKDHSGLRLVDYRNLGSEELGSIYESLLELNPTMELGVGVFTLEVVAGSERKTTGSYYTPESLIQCLLDSALDPVLNQAALQPEPEKAILNLKICDPACGSGHFLIAAAHRVARQLASVRSGEEAPSPEFIRSALRDVIGHCLFGVDLNPMAVELCKVSLWLEALEPRKPLSFLDHHIRVGNSLLGTTPELIAAGLPDGAFTFVDGDDKKACAVLKKRNKGESFGWGPLFSQQEEEIQTHLQMAAAALESLPDTRPEELRVKEQTFHHSEHTIEFLHKKLLADAWCSAFFIPKTLRIPGQENSARGITQGHIIDLAAGQPLPADLRDEIKVLAEHHRFFHWHLAFPEVFARGGFDVVLGNPPWDKIQPEEGKFFASNRPDIAFAGSAKQRKALIEALPQTDPAMHQLWTTHKRGIDSVCQFLGASGVLRFTGEGNLNTYRIFTEIGAGLLSKLGRAGMVVQTGLATDESGKELFWFLVSEHRLIRFLDFENRQGFFPDVDSRFRFCLITLSGTGSSEQKVEAEFSWMLQSMEEVDDPQRSLLITLEDLLLFNPSSKTCPVLTSRKELEISRKIYRNSVHVYISPTQRLGEVDFLGELFNMTRDSKYFKSQDVDKCEATLPLYEAKYLHQYDHRFATTMGAQPIGPSLVEKADAEFFAKTSRVVEEQEVTRRLKNRGIVSKWLCGFRDIAAPTNERTSIMSVFPLSAVGNSINLVLGLNAPQIATLLANANSFVFDYCCRQKVSGTHVNIWIFKQLPAIPFERYTNQCPWSDEGESIHAWVMPRVLELCYTAWDIQFFAKDCGYEIQPFVWNEDRRFKIQCELDAAFFHLYGLTHDEVDYIMDTFPIVRRKDEAAFSGDYRTKSLILEIYDDMQESIRIRNPYQTRLDPPPADPRCCHSLKQA